jgi:hypothetical protein
LVAGVTVMVMISLFIFIHYTAPPKDWGDLSQALIYHQGKISFACVFFICFYSVDNSYNTSTLLVRKYLLILVILFLFEKHSYFCATFQYFLFRMRERIM